VERHLLWTLTGKEARVYGILVWIVEYYVVCMSCEPVLMYRSLFSLLVFADPFVYDLILPTGRLVWQRPACCCRFRIIFLQNVTGWWYCHYCVVVIRQDVFVDGVYKLKVIRPTGWSTVHSCFTTYVGQTVGLLTWWLSLCIAVYIMLHVRALLHPPVKLRTHANKQWINWSTVSWKACDVIIVSVMSLLRVIVLIA